jgi:hypothetical protein
MMRAIAISAEISAYSIAVAPRWSEKNSFINGMVRSLRMSEGTVMRASYREVTKNGQEMRFVIMRKTPFKGATGRIR